MGFIMMITAASLLTYSDTAKLYLASVLHGSREKIQEAKALAPSYVIKSAFKKSADAFTENEAPTGMVAISVGQDAQNSFALPGAKNAPVMSLNFKTGNEPMELKSLKLKIAGVEKEQIENAYLVFVDKNLQGERDGEYFIFENIDYSLDAETAGSVEVKADLGADLKTGQRLRFDIEKQDDIGMRVAGSMQKINSRYPIKGEYLTISRPRVWNFSEKIK